MLNNDEDYSVNEIILYNIKIQLIATPVTSVLKVLILVIIE